MVRRSIWVGFVVVCLACGSKTPTSLAQAVYGSILGTVTDPHGSSVAGGKGTGGVGVGCLGKDGDFSKFRNVRAKRLGLCEEKKKPPKAFDGLQVAVSRMPA